MRNGLRDRFDLCPRFFLIKPDRFMYACVSVIFTEERS